MNDMKNILKEKCDLFIANRDAFKAAFPMESSYLYPVCASYFVDLGRVADTQQLKNCRKLLKSRVSVFSNFRSSAELTIVAMLASHDEPEKYLDDAMEIYKSLKEHFFGSEYLPVASMILAQGISHERYAEVCEKSRKIYDLMKKNHPFLTSSEDCVFCAMLAMSEKSAEQIVNETEVCYEKLRERFSGRNAAQSLSHVIVLSDDSGLSIGDRCRDTIRLFDALKEKKHKYGTGYELATLGVLSTLPCGIEETVQDIIVVSDFLKTQKGYGFMGFDRVPRLMHAGMIVTSAHLGETRTMQGAAIGSTLSIIAAQQAATCAVLAASMAATSVATRS